tara:strand:- start:401 stop:694 length:294 start_codon:yes stop_codon:yes gene_type:complete
VYKKSITKIDLIKNLSNKTGFSFNYSKKLINDLIDILIQNIETGNLILKNVGSFRLISKKERIGRNPKTKEEFLITARKSISFKASKEILLYFNKKI